MMNLSIRARIIILVVLSALPTLAVTLYGSWDESVRSVAEVREDMLRLATVAAQQQAQVIEGAKQTLVAISLIPAALRDDRARCNAYLAQLLLKSAGLYHSMGIYGTDGVLQCNAIPWQGTVYSPDRSYFKLAMASGRFAVGEYQIGRVTKLEGINFGYPIADAGGRISGVAFVAVDLERLNKMASAVPLPEQGALAVIDRDGTLLARQPPTLGKPGAKLPFAQILKVVLAGRSGEFEAAGYGGTDQLVAYGSVAENPDGEIAMRVIVSMPLSVVVAAASRAMTRDVAGILIATVLLLIGAWYGAEVFVLRHFKILLGVANNVEAGNLGARTRLAGGHDELAQLGVALDNMVNALQRRDMELQNAMHEMEQRAITDVLTGLNNRRYLYELMPRELTRARRNNTAVAVMLMDIDHFKRVNDTYGHEAGDLVLKEVARVIKTTSRASDVCFRYGGEEIAVVLPDALVDGARVRAETLRAAIEKLEVEVPGHQRIKVTVSIGVAIYPENGVDTDALLRAADEALYEAKGAGRNRVMVYAGGEAARKCGNQQG